MALTSRSQLTFDGTVTEEPFNFFTQAPGQHAQVASTSFSGGGFATSPSGQYVSRTNSPNITAPDNNGFQYFIPRNYPNDSPAQFRARTNEEYDFDSGMFGMLGSKYGPMVREALQTRPVQNRGTQAMSAWVAGDNPNTGQTQRADIGVSIDHTLGEKQATFGTPEYFRKVYRDTLPDDPAADAWTLDFMYSRGGIQRIEGMAANGSRPAQIALLNKAKAEGDYRYSGPTWAISSSGINKPLPGSYNYDVGFSGTKYHTGFNGQITAFETASPGGYLFDGKGGTYGSSWSMTSLGPNTVYRAPSTKGWN